MGEKDKNWAYTEKKIRKKLRLIDRIRAKAYPMMGSLLRTSLTPLRGSKEKRPPGPESTSST